MKKEYNFEPNYKEWWNKENLEKEELLWLMLGINPNDTKHARELDNKTSLTTEEIQWKNSFFNYYYNIDAFIGKTIKQHDELLEWKDSKHTLLKDAYEAHLPINDSFLNHLVSIDEFKNNPKLENYKDHSKYKLNEEEVSTDSISNEEEAFAVLLGLNHEFFSHFVKLDNLQAETPKDERGYAAYINFSPEDKWFYSSYRKFIGNEYAHLDMFSDSKLLSTYKKAKALNGWNDSFKDYTKLLNDEGFIFRQETYTYLASNSIEIICSDDAWATRFYQRWIKEGLWSVKEALALLKGNDPRKDKRGFEDLSQNPFIINFTKDEPSAWDIFDDNFFDVEKRLQKHVAAEHIEAFDCNGVLHYKPKAVIEWMIEHIPVNPPKALLDILSLETQDSYNKEKEGKEASEGLKKKRNEDILICIGFAWKKAKGNSEKNPSSESVWNVIKKEHADNDNFECIQEVNFSEEIKEDAIFWKSETSGEQRLGRGAFNNKVSDFNTGKYDSFLKSQNNFK